MSEWTNVNDKLPQNFETVLALCKDGGMFVGRYTPFGHWEIWTAMKSTRIVKRTVTHWMPLPELPKGVSNMTCKDCIHDNACSSIFRFYGGNPDYMWNRVEDTCKPFQNKANFVEVVRCKDCKYYKANSCFNRQWDLESSVEIPLVREDDYCSYGERKCDNG